jgi:GNAT superfamily N-acetyltransferase
MCHFAAYHDDRCVAIATIVIWMQYAGLYSVATHHDYRRRGFGREISRVASLWAMQQNVKGILLQTEADSVVEKMYTRARISENTCWITGYTKMRSH